MAGRSRGHGDDHPGPLGDHAGEKCRNGQEGRGEVGLDHLTPMCAGLGGGGNGHAVSAGEDGKDVDRSECLCNLLLQRGQLLFDGAVGHHPDGSCSNSANGGNRAVQRNAVTADDGDRYPVGTERHRRGCADSPRAAGDHGNFACQVRVGGGARREATDRRCHRAASARASAAPGMGGAPGVPATKLMWIAASRGSPAAVASTSVARTASGMGWP